MFFTVWLLFLSYILSSIFSLVNTSFYGLPVIKGFTSFCSSFSRFCTTLMCLPMHHASSLFITTLTHCGRFSKFQLHLRKSPFYWLLFSPSYMVMFETFTLQVPQAPSGMLLQGFAWSMTGTGFIDCIC